MTASERAGAREMVPGMVGRSPATAAVLRLCRELEAFGITADPHEGDEVAALSVYRDLVVWCERGSDGMHYRWWTGRISVRTRRWVYTLCPVDACQTAARRVDARYRELRAASADSRAGQWRS